jgi:hypothetical protein
MSSRHKGSNTGERLPEVELARSQTGGIPVHLPLKAIRHPYTEIWNSTESPPLGSILVVPTKVVAPVLVGQIARHCWPWCPVVVIDPTEQLERQLVSLRPQVTIPVPVTSRAERVDSILQVIRRRSMPGSGAVADYVGHRLHDESLRALICTIGPLRTMRRSHRSTAWRGFHRKGSLTARDWRKIVALANMAQLTGQDDLYSFERLASDAGMEARTARAALSSLVKLPWRAVRSYVGWEWLVEHILRLRGYVKLSQ